MYYFAQTETGYGCANYGETDAYNSCEVTPSSSEDLSNTGSMVAVPVVGSGLILVVALVLMFMGKKKKK